MKWLAPRATRSSCCPACGRSGPEFPDVEDGPDAFLSEAAGLGGSDAAQAVARRPRRVHAGPGQARRSICRCETRLRLPARRRTSRPVRSLRRFPASPAADVEVLLRSPSPAPQPPTVLAPAEVSTSAESPPGERTRSYALLWFDWSGDRGGDRARRVDCGVEATRCGAGAAAAGGSVGRARPRRSPVPSRFPPSPKPLTQAPAPPAPQSPDACGGAADRLHPAETSVTAPPAVASRADGASACRARGRRQPGATARRLA